MRRVIALRRLRTLDVAAASGLVVHDGRLHVVADDDLFLHVYADDGARRVARVPLFPGDLPADPAARKARKPDLEALVLVPGAGLLALGSGSRPNRRSGALVPLPAGEAGPARAVDLAPLYEALGARFTALNVEGAAVAGATLRLLQRGNGLGGASAVVDLDLAGVVDALARGRPLDGALVRDVHAVELGTLGGVPLAFTDASPLGDGRIAFAAAAEATPDVYEDGPCAGAALGVLDAGAALVHLEPVDEPLKVEGLHAFAPSSDGSVDVLVVADADDPSRPTPLCCATLRPRGPS
jgi:hypothetical protein